MTYKAPKKEMEEFRDLFQAAHDGTSTIAQDNEACDIIRTWMKRARRKRLSA